MEEILLRSFQSWSLNWSSFTTASFLHFGEEPHVRSAEVAISFISTLFAPNIIAHLLFSPQIFIYHCAEIRPYLQWILGMIPTSFGILGMIPLNYPQMTSLRFSHHQSSPSQVIYLLGGKKNGTLKDVNILFFFGYKERHQQTSIFRILYWNFNFSFIFVCYFWWNPGDDSNWMCLLRLFGHFFTRLSYEAHGCGLDRAPLAEYLAKKATSIMKDPILPGILADYNWFHLISKPEVHFVIFSRTFRAEICCLTIRLHTQVTPLWGRYGSGCAGKPALQDVQIWRLESGVTKPLIKRSRELFSFQRRHQVNLIINLVWGHLAFHPQIVETAGTRCYHKFLVSQIWVYISPSWSNIWFRTSGCSDWRIAGHQGGGWMKWREFIHVLIWGKTRREMIPLFPGLQSNHRWVNFPSLWWDIAFICIYIYIAQATKIET